jgi:hypothetical protein
MPGMSPENRRREPPPGRENQSPESALPLPLDILLSNARGVLSEMANNRDLRSEGGEPCFAAEACGQDSESTWIDFTADFSAIGMPIDSPFLVTSFRGDAWLEWNLGPVPIAKTPRSSSPKEAADILEMNALLDAFRRFVLASA